MAATNDSMTTRFNVTTPRLLATDRRPWYRLVGAIWQDVPTGTSSVLGTPGTFTVNRALVNDMTDPDIVLNGSDSVDSITGGEDRISSLAMESFTQGEASFPSCFHCHDTQATNADRARRVALGRHAERHHRGTVSLAYDGTVVGQGRVEQTIPFIFSADETTDIGRATGTTVSTDYTAHDETFSGKIDWVQIETANAEDDRASAPAERIRIALARQ